jgi:regulator of sigma E protease
MWFLTLIVFILILGLIVLVHELGHFLWAKKFGVFIYEFSIGMGPVLYTKKGKDGINYNIRALPIGGFVSMAGEVYEDDKEVPKEKCLCNKPVWQRIIVMAAGVMNNFILALIILLFMSFIWGSYNIKPIIKEVKEEYPMAIAGIKSGDEIIAINNHKVKTWDEAQIILYFKNKNSFYTFKVKHSDKTIDEYKVTPVKEKTETGEERTVFGMTVNQDATHGIWNKIKYAFQKFNSIVVSMYLTLGGLLTGKISVNALSGPVGIYSVVGESMKYGFVNIIYLLAYLSINVGVINILPFPAFDGGRIFFLIIEKIKGSPVNQKFENTCHTIGFILLMILIIYVSIHDIIKLL